MVATDERSKKVRLRLGASRHIDIEPGSMVLVRDGEDTYGAMVRKIVGVTAHLTFTPEGRPEDVPLGLIVCAVAKPATMNLSSVPRYQPEPSATPRRRKGRG